MEIFILLIVMIGAVATVDLRDKKSDDEKTVDDQCS